MQEGFEIGELSPTHHEKHVPPFNEAFHARMQKYPALKKWIDLETMWGTIETEYVHKDGSVFWGILNAHYLRDDEGNITGTEAIIHENTERRSMEHAIREANRKLSLLNTITRHDVANQLTALQGFIQIASMKKTDPVIADYLAKIGNVAATITRQIRIHAELPGTGYQSTGLVWNRRYCSSNRMPGTRPFLRHVPGSGNIRRSNA